MKSIRILLLFGLLFLISTCKKDPDNPSGSNKFEYNTSSADSVSYFQAFLKTSITNFGGNDVLKYGHCWSTLINPGLQDSITSFQGNPQNLNFQSQLYGLLPNTKYYTRAYCSLKNTTVFSDEIEFTTLKTGFPVVFTLDVYDITLISAKCDGQVVFDSGLVVSQRGVVWDTVNEFDTSENLGKMIGGTGTGQFSCQLSQLLEGKTYFIKAFAVNDAGTAYGEMKSFETIPLQLPQVTTAEISQITTITAQCGGNVTGTGNGTVSARGVCWGLDTNPTTNNCTGFTADGAGTGEFMSSITGLTDGTIYYARAYATNEKGTAYGDQQSFQTISINLPTVITSEVISVTTTSAQSGGNVTSSGNGTVSARGVCFGISADITLENCLGFTNDGNGTGSYTSGITGLTPGNTYYVRAYATNQNGTGYGTTLDFNTPDIPSLSTADVINITANSAQSGGTVTHNGFGTVSGRGICWGLNPNPALGNCTGYTNNGSGEGSFTSNLTNLTASTIYYVRAYATNESGTGYGDLKSFYSGAPGFPIVISANLTDITTTTATSGGNVTSDGGSPVTVRGVCWSTSPNPTTANSHTTDGGGTGTFTSSLIGLTPNTPYYVKAYATNSLGTAYGNQQNFITLQIATMPIVTTNTATDITQTTATSGGNVTSDGGAPVTVRGVCWSTSPNPSLANSHTTDGSGIGTFTSYMSGLTPNTAYYVRSYATNTVGTAYGNEQSFPTQQNPISPLLTTNTVTDITQTAASSGGNVTSDGGAPVTVRGVCWSTSPNPSLANSHTTDGSGTGPFSSYLTSLTQNTPYYVRAYATNSVGTSYGNQQSFTTLQTFTIPILTTNTVMDITQTTASSGGNVTSDGGAPITIRGVCWSTSPNPTTANSHTTDGGGTGTFTSSLTGLAPNTPYYVRAYATNSVGTAYGNQQNFTTLQNQTVPTVTTNSVTDITQTTATCGGNVTSNGGATITVRGVCWSTSPNPTTANSHTTDGSGTGIFTSFLTGLVPNTEYYVRAYATNNVGTAFGNEQSFTTLNEADPCPGIPTITYGGKVYNTVQIGTQCWLKENLDIGTRIDVSQDQSNNSTIEKYCCENNEANCNVYGGLYQWNEMIQYITLEEAKGICPDEWHIPSDAEWTILNTYLGGESVAGGKMKSTGTLEAGTGLWHSPNESATNSSGFTALPGSYRNLGGGSAQPGDFGFFWSSSQYDATNAWRRRLYYTSGELGNSNSGKENGFSVRCLKD